MTAQLTISELAGLGRRAVQAGDWARVGACAQEIIARSGREPEGHFLRGLAEKAQRRPKSALASFEKVLSLDPRRYDAAIELAQQFASMQRHAEAKVLLEQYEERLGNSPLYLNMAGATYSMLGMHDRAWALHRKACDLQPGVDLFQSNLAACSVYVGRVEEAGTIYRDLLERFPTHQRHHFQLSRIARATDSRHVEQMKEVLRNTRLPDDRNIFLYYAIGKELEDLEQWDEAFHYYKLAGDTITRKTAYDVGRDVQVIETVIEVCTPGWLTARGAQRNSEKTPVFIVGLPRTGTTLTERIISSHSWVSTLDETHFMRLTLQRESGHADASEMTPEIIRAASCVVPERIARGYLDAVRYRLGGEPWFIDKLPENVLYAGFIAKAWPDARLVHLRRNPMDACFAMYKQSFFKFAYSLENIARYYVAYRQLVEHWRRVLGVRFIEVEYEALVRDQEGQTRALLERLGLPFEPACLRFEENKAPSATASAAQVREKMHSRSIGRWRLFARHLEPLKAHLEAAGIAAE